MNRVTKCSADWPCFIRRVFRLFAAGKREVTRAELFCNKHGSFKHSSLRVIKNPTVCGEFNAFPSTVSSSLVMHRKMKFFEINTSKEFEEMRKLRSAGIISEKVYTVVPSFRFPSRLFRISLLARPVSLPPLTLYRKLNLKLTRPTAFIGVERVVNSVQQVMLHERVALQFLAVELPRSIANDNRVAFKELPPVLRHFC